MTTHTPDPIPRRAAIWRLRVTGCESVGRKNGRTRATSSNCQTTLRTSPPFVPPSWGRLWLGA